MTPDPAATGSLALHALSAGWTDVPVVRDLDLVVESGTRLALLGASGSGKSTLLRTIAGLLPPLAGRVELDGRDLSDVPAHRRGIGMVFQGQALFPHATVGANVAFAAAVAGASRAQRAAIAGDWLERVGLVGFEGRDVSTLSGGQAQRVALARTLAAQPAVVLLDEPLSGLDTGLRGDLLRQMRELFTAEGTTVVHVTHDVTEAAALADRLAVLHDGSLAQIGAPKDVLRNPASADVAALIGGIHRPIGGGELA